MAALLVQYKATLRRIRPQKVFLATDMEESDPVLMALRKESPTSIQRLNAAMLGEASDILPGRQVEALKGGEMAILEQIICVRADSFIGTYQSTFTQETTQNKEATSANPDSNPAMSGDF